MSKNVNASAWSSYWDDSAATPGAVRGDGMQAALDQFWRETLRSGWLVEGRSLHLDMACGSGGVTRASIAAAQSISSVPRHFACMDYSSAAVSQALSVNGRETVMGLVADATATGLASASFDLVTSQFGLEYAGPGAFHEAWRLLAPGGQLIILSHIEGGPIARECAETLDPLERMSGSAILLRLLDVIQTLEGDQLDLRQSNRSADIAALIADCAGLFDVTRQSAPSAGGEFVLRLLNDLSQLLKRLPSYQRTDVVHWIEHQNRELDAYRARMSSMLDAALSEVSVRQFIESLDPVPVDQPGVEPWTIDGEREACAWLLSLSR